MDLPALQWAAWKPESCSSPESRAAQRGQPPRPCSGSSIASPVGFFCSFGGVAASCAGTDDWEPVTVGPTGDVAAAVGGDGGCGTESVVAAGGDGD